MKSISTYFISVALVIFSVNAFSEDKGIVASNTPKVFEGKEGEKITILEINSSSQVLVKFQGTGGEYEGKIILWNLESTSDKKDIFFEIGEGRKAKRTVLLTYRFGNWEYHPPKSNSNGLKLTFSKEETKNLTTNALIQEYKAQSK
jgi:hypothetical protein